MVKHKPFTWEIDENGCHTCTSHALRGDYPGVMVGGNETSIARHLWADAHGPLPKGMVIRHRCDNPGCINLEHLEIGTYADNTRDAWERGRGKIPHKMGEVHGSAKLTEKSVREIRAFGPGITQRMIGLIYSVSDATISMIRNNKIWRHIL